ncbi:hypothetical protein EPA93_32525 [Ktedonosporobacter rubrisoli]|uniref:Uncharacterized protein n=1 Tax=Ktedonosporobacter rubrisoli TaxID=2509675 RepID=A0A4P6JXG6_KTERU|nr:hypothetical protein [Ktedonosporobacter rubrisoli]QBD80447.1 hypothetical protein EPA93_32525 [Ktedonosporobacter rubrisoli]
MGQHREYLWIIASIPTGADAQSWRQLVKVYAVNEEQARQRAFERLAQLAPWEWQLERAVFCPHGFLMYRRRLPGSRLVDDETGAIVQEPED